MKLGGGRPQVEVPLKPYQVSWVVWVELVHKSGQVLLSLLSVSSKRASDELKVQLRRLGLVG